MRIDNPNVYITNYHKGTPALVIKCENKNYYFSFDDMENFNPISEEEFLKGNYIGRIVPHKGDVANFHIDYGHFNFELEEPAEINKHTEIICDLNGDTLTQKTDELKVLIKGLTLF